MTENSNSRIIVRSLVLLLTAATLSCTFIRRPSFDLGTVSGVVLGADDLTPLAGAQVRMVNTRVKTTADSIGRFLLTKVPLGRRTIEATQTGYRRSLLRRVDVRLDQATCTLAFMERNRTRRVVVRTAPAPSPLVIVDAVVRKSTVPRQSFSVSDSESIHFQDVVLPAIPRANIASVEIVQPSAGKQLYGERGALGVIVLTTKSQVLCP